MKAIKIALILLTTAAVLLFIRDGTAMDLRKLLPFCDGEPVNNYHFGDLIICLIAIWGLARLMRQGGNDR